MKFQLTRAEGRNLFTGYGEGYVSINHERHERSIVVTPGMIELGADLCRRHGPMPV